MAPHLRCRFRTFMWFHTDNVDRSTRWVLLAWNAISLEPFHHWSLHTGVMCGVAICLDMALPCKYSARVHVFLLWRVVYSVFGMVQITELAFIGFYRSIFCKDEICFDQTNWFVIKSLVLQHVVTMPDKMLLKHIKDGITVLMMHTCAICEIKKKTMAGHTETMNLTALVDWVLLHHEDAGECLFRMELFPPGCHCAWMHLHDTTSGDGLCCTADVPERMCTTHDVEILSV